MTTNKPDAIVELLSEFRKHVRAIPVDTYCEQKGNSAYNWGRHYEIVLSKIIATLKQPATTDEAQARVAELNEVRDALVVLVNQNVPATKAWRDGIKAYAIINLMIEKQTTTVDEDVVERCVNAILDLPECQSEWVENHLAIPAFPRGQAEIFARAVLTAANITTPTLDAAEINAEIKDIPTGMAAMIADGTRRVVMELKEVREALRFLADETNYEAGSDYMSDRAEKALTTLNRIISTNEDKHGK